MAAGARLHLTAECLNPPVEQVPLVRGSVARVPFLASNTSDERISMNTNRALRTSAIAFAVLYFVAMFAPDLPEGTYSDSRVLGLVNDDGSMVVLAGYALAAAGAVFLCWLAGVTTRLRGAGGSALVDLALLAGAAYGVLLMVASTFFSTIALGHSIGELPPAEDAFLVRAFSNQGFHLVLVPALLCAGLLMTAVSLGARRQAVLPRWAVVAGLCLAPLMLAGAVWVPQFLVPVWAIVVAFSLRTTEDQDEASHRSVATHNSRAASASSASGEGSAGLPARW